MKRLVKYLFILAVVLAVAAGAAGGAVYMMLAPKLPPVEALRDVHLQVPLRVFTKDGELIAEFGEMRRIPLRYEEIPPLMIQAFLAAEDERFFSHPGVDYQGLLRAVWHLVRTGEKGPGGSTITMQVARNFFLSREKTYLRKANEILLALKIDRELSKEEILELYLNKIFLGHRAYGVGAAAQIYYGRPPSELTIAEIAMIAGLPQAPSTANPVSNPRAALQRRAYVLRRMLTLGVIDRQQFEEAMAAPVTARIHGIEPGVEAPHLAEMVRAEMVARFGAEEAYTGGYEVITTIDGRMQTAANRAVRNGLLAYDERHGYRGPIGKLTEQQMLDSEARRTALASYRPVGGLLPALVTGVDDDGADIYLPSLDEEVRLPKAGLAWARPFLSRDSQGRFPSKPADVLAVGDVIRVRLTEEGYRLAQQPEPEAALVAMAPDDGRLLALAGGFDFYQSRFNRVTQAQRQPGSSFKPFIYSAALERDFTPATIVNDAPVVFRDEALEGTWRPENYSRRFYGPTRLREALTHSRNLVSIRVLQSIGIGYAIEHLENFGFAADRMPRNLSLSLGSPSVTPLELTTGYAVFANGGYLVEPWFIEQIRDSDGKVIFAASPKTACEDCSMPEVENDELVEVGGEEIAEPVVTPVPAPRTITPQNAYLMTSMMRDAVRYGTGRRLLQLGRSDLAGKTGTTNEQRDAWFSGYNGDIVATVWLGFDKHDPLGAGETGSTAALPVWLDFMRVALADKPERTLPQPEGLVTVRIDPDTGYATTADNPRAIFEVFYADKVPPADSELGGPPSGGGSEAGGAGTLF